jgi:hypothetical protein
MDSNTLTTYFKVMVTDISESNRLVLEITIDDCYSKTASFSDDIIVSSDIQKTLQQFDIFISIMEVNTILTSFQFKSENVAGTAERMWYVKAK